MIETDNYRKKPVVIQAVQITDDWFDRDHPNPLHPIGIMLYPIERQAEVTTLEGVMRGNVGDWLITGVKGEKYFCKPYIFEQTYEPVDALFKGDESGLLTPEALKHAHFEGVYDYPDDMINEITYNSADAEADKRVAKAQKFLCDKDKEAERVKVAEEIFSEIDTCKIRTDVFQEDGSKILSKGDIVIPQLYYDNALKSKYTEVKGKE